ncbi:hypothetical protein [Spirochaeta lutea]|uniref:DUF3244 domain-containing protein n=1 Tax=Spirochaeta lutea TaxID=1480694 RepID=A0A098R292_9SPIO|nr:hypothetical protein [Spirochaeta lutea]KGE73876.1 hypothetical protein DC28_01340 [Spirochaeta lutea]
MNIKRLFLGVLTAGLLLLGSCNLPNSSGLSGSITGTDSSGTTEIIVGDTTRDLQLEGSYQIDAGTLTVVITNPDGEEVRNENYGQGTSGSVNWALESSVGTWNLQVNAKSFSGSYEFRFVY